MEKPWIKVVSASEESGYYGKTLTRCKKPWLAAISINWYNEQGLKSRLLIDGYDYGVCPSYSRTVVVWEESVAVAYEHVQDCLNIHKAFYEKTLDLDEEKV